MITVRDLMDRCDGQGLAYESALLLVDGADAIPVFATEVDHVLGLDPSVGRWQGLLLAAPDDLGDDDPGLYPTVGEP